MMGNYGSTKRLQPLLESL